MGNDAIYSAIKSAKRKRLLWGYKTLYEPISTHSEAQLRELERDGGFQFPVAVKEALLSLGGCSIDDLYIHPTDRICRFDEQNGKMLGLVAFASDIFGNCFAFDPSSSTPDKIYYYSHDPLGHAVVAADFSDYLQSFVSSGFDTVALTSELVLDEC